MVSAIKVFSHIFYWSCFNSFVSANLNVSYYARKDWIQGTQHTTSMQVSPTLDSWWLSVGFSSEKEMGKGFDEFVIPTTYL